MKSFLYRLRNANRGVLMLTALLLAMFVVAIAGTAKAADKGKVKVDAPAGVIVTEVSWTGFGVDVHGSLATGTADFGAPVNLSMDGKMAGGGVYYNHQFGSIVLGVDLGYDRLWGDLHDFGIDYALTVGIRAGVLPTKSTLIYARGEWIRAVGSGDHLDGWGVGAGIETKVSGTPLSLSLEWMHDFFEKEAFGPGVDVTADRITARAKFDLYSKPATSIFADR